MYVYIGTWKHWEYGTNTEVLSARIGHPRHFLMGVPENPQNSPSGPLCSPATASKQVHRWLLPPSINLNQRVHVDTIGLDWLYSMYQGHVFYQKDSYDRTFFEPTGKSGLAMYPLKNM